MVKGRGVASGTAMQRGNLDTKQRGLDLAAQASNGAEGEEVRQKQFEADMVNREE